MPVTLLTNDNNLAMKAQSNGIVALASTSPTNEPLSSDVLIRQALHGPLPLENAFIRPKEGSDTCMFDLSGTAEDHLKFLPGLNSSRHAPKSPMRNVDKSKIAIDLETGTVVLVKNDERNASSKFERSQNLDEPGVVEGEGPQEHRVDRVDGHTYADIMASQNKGLESHMRDDEMDWE